MIWLNIKMSKVICKFFDGFLNNNFYYVKIMIK
uniref:Uncharacterized protein n=1 Tax=Siphoviridae sp. ctBrh2 TaxID=2827804 RepID=A0A8S5S766_9CAUD|nr:MAG TPA: hypothetical protein [Siphoviridae sp. ctBrh2]